MLNIDEDTITQAVIARLADTTDPRLRQVMTSLVQHLHAFAREVRLSEAEWFEAIRFLTRVGQTCSDTRQEFILLSDTLGLSTLVTAQNTRKPPGCTESTVFGPFHVEGAPRLPLGADVAQGARGLPCWVEGRIRGLRGEPIAGATIDVWQAVAEGFYDVQRPELPHPQARAVLASDEAGGYRFWTVLAEAYPIPDDGPVGELLKATGRHPWRPAHLHFMIQAPGYERLITHVFRNDDPYLESDAVFGVRSSLLADWIRHEPGTAPDGTRRDAPWYSLEFDFVLNPVRG
jgi:hydroxyquinol 1,2-dioxygenase